MLSHTVLIQSSVAKVKEFQCNIYPTMGRSVSSLVSLPLSKNVRFRLQSETVVFTLKEPP